METSRHNAIAAWFLGPKAENSTYLFEFFNRVLAAQSRARRRLYSRDEEFITAEMEDSDEFRDSMKLLDVELGTISTMLAKHSVPFWSPRYNGHMLMDTSMPALIGYLSTMLYNPNNVALEASPYTTIVETKAAQQLCKMLGYNIEPSETEPLSWGHITCGGSVANLESIWAARNLKFYPLSLQLATKPGGPLEFITKDPPFTVELAAGETKSIKNCEAWELLNLKPATVLNIPQQLFESYGISQTFLGKALYPFSIQTLGLDGLRAACSLANPPGKIFVPATKHYSWPKGAAIAGIGSVNCVEVAVDDSARMDLSDLRAKLNECIRTSTPVYAVVAVMGSTEHGAVDPLADIVTLRSEFERDGLSFVIHADAAWGGYFASMLVDRGPREHFDSSFVPALSLSEHTEKHLIAFKYADSITIDPHKSGFAPYPAGGLCYLDGRMRYLVTWTSPVVFRDTDATESIGVYGVEGSKPGASGVGIYLSHQVLGLNAAGYGALLGEATWTCTRLYCHWATMAPLQATEMGELIVVPFNMLPTEKEGQSSTEVEEERSKVKKITTLSNEELVEEGNEALLHLLQKLGSDLMINAFACNFRVGSSVNTDVIEANYLNNRIFNRLSVSSTKDKVADRPIIITSTTLSQGSYGACLTKFKERLGLKGDQDLYVLINVTMSPWPTTSNFLRNMAGDFMDVAGKLVKASLARNTLSSDNYRFILQGTKAAGGAGMVYGVHLAAFNSANHRIQLVITGQLPPQIWALYDGAKQQTPEKFFTISTLEQVQLSSIIGEGRSFRARIDCGFPEAGVEPIAMDFIFSDISVIINTNLTANELDTNYPNLMPFHLYGTSEQKHIDHLLRASPNVMLNSDQVILSDMNPELTDQELRNGVIAVFTNVRESSLQPMQRLASTTPPHQWRSQKFDFIPGAKFPITVYKNWADAKEGRSQISTGNLTLGTSVFADDRLLNKDPGTDSRGLFVAPNLGDTMDTPDVHFPGAFLEHREVVKHRLAEEWRDEWEKTKKELAIPRRDW
ncbi:pyridoxal phosphate-dependent transferase [Tirmania nivea]|nr:pyridoxal phosphate-dependent transferase [Tirmania nivea]